MDVGVQEIVSSSSSSNHSSNKTDSKDRILARQKSVCTHQGGPGEPLPPERTPGGVETLPELPLRPETCRKASEGAGMAETALWEPHLHLKQKSREERLLRSRILVLKFAPRDVDVHTGAEGGDDCAKRNTMHLQSSQKVSNSFLLLHPAVNIHTHTTSVLCIL